MTDPPRAEHAGAVLARGAVEGDGVGLLCREHAQRRAELRLRARGEHLSLPFMLMFISGGLPEKARLDTAGVIKVNVYVKLVHCYQSSSTSTRVGRP